MWIVYGLPDESVETAAFVEGLRRISRPFRVLNHNGFARGQHEWDATRVFVSGLRGQGAEIRAAYNERGIDVAVCDYGYLNRVSGIATFQTGHWQLGLNRLGWIVPDPMPVDRFQALGIPIRRRSNRGRAVYVCGQHAGDPSHGLDRDGIAQWAMREIGYVRARTMRPIVWRSHPDSPLEIGGVEQSAGLIDWDDVYSVICINSNVGLEALLNGVPVFCREDAPYAALGARRFAEKVNPPSVRDVQDYLARVAWSQWTLAEIRTGKPIEFLETRMRKP